MDIVGLSAAVTAFLSPLLPYLVKLGDKAGEEVAKKFGAAAWDRVKALWDRLRPGLENKPAAREAVAELAVNPDDAEAQAALRWQMRKWLEADPALAGELARWLAEARQAGVVAIASGERSVAVGGDVSGSTIITGDGNR